MHNQLLGLPRVIKRLLVVSLDVVMSLMATWLAFSLRLDGLHWPTGMQWWVYGLAPALATPVFAQFGLYRAIFRYTGQAALTATAQAVGVYAAMLMVLLLWQSWPEVPRSIGLLQPLIFLLLVGGSRALARFWFAAVARDSNTGDGRMLIFGAGEAGVQIASALSNSGQYVLLGFVDEDPAKIGRSINGLPVYSPQQLELVVTRRGATDILLALPSVSRMRRNRIIESLRPLPVHIRTLPAMADLASGRVKVQDLRELDVEDLLGRDPVLPDATLLERTLKDTRVLVTGAGGSIGSELCRQIVQAQPRQLLLLDHSEFALYSIHQELERQCADLGVELIPLLGNVTHHRRLEEICKQYRPQTVYHAAAYKHVPIVEANPAEGIYNNVFGTLNTAQVARRNGVERFVLISTDKAVRPANVMGASKRMAEQVLQALAVQSGGSDTCFSMVRFGNVLGSSGSVVPLFRRQLASGGPLTVTHAEVTRYFMTIPEAAQLVLQAGAMAVGGDVFVLDMGEPVKIIDLARRMIELSGLTVRGPDKPDGDIEIVITGLRPGEKLYEELLIGDNPVPTAHQRIMKAHEEYIPWPMLEQYLATLKSAADRNDTEAVKAVLRECVRGYGRH